MLNEVRGELHRIRAAKVRVELDSAFAPEAGELVKVELNGAYWHLLPNRFLTLLKELPQEAGDEAVHVAIEARAMFVWHGPAPLGSLDSSVSP